MKLMLVASLFMGVADASPFYFQTTIGGAGSFDRGLDRPTASIAIGAAVYETERFGIDLEAGYTRIGTVKGKPTIEHTVWYDPGPVVPAPIEIPAPPVGPEPIDPPQITSEPPEPIGPPDQFKIKDPVTPPDFAIPAPDPPPEPDTGDDKPILVIDVPIDLAIPRSVLARSANGIPGSIKINGQELKAYIPKFNTDLYQGTIGARLKIGNFLWIQLRGGVEQKVIDGQIEEKRQKGEVINWRIKEKFRDDAITYIIGGSALFNLRKQLMGVVRFDYHDLNNRVDDDSFQTDDIIVGAGLRFGF